VEGFVKGVEPTTVEICSSKKRAGCSGRDSLIKASRGWAKGEVMDWRTKDPSSAHRAFRNADTLNTLTMKRDLMHENLQLIVKRTQNPRPKISVG